MFKKNCSILLFIIAVNVLSQNTQNGWNVYTSMKDVKSVSLLGNEIWGTSSGGLFHFDASNFSILGKFTTLDGLLSNELNAGTADLNGNVWVGALDGSINVYYPSSKTWKVVTDIRNSGKPNRKINHFFQYGDQMFFATQFCIVRFSISQFQFIDQPYTFYIQNNIEAPVNWIHVVNDTIWAATQYGIAYANVNSSLPIGSSWKNFNTNNSVLNKNLVNTIAYFNNRVYFGTDSGMVYFQNGVLSRYEPLFNGIPLREGVNNIYASGNSMYFSSYRNSDRIYKVDNTNLLNATEVYSGFPVNNFKMSSNGDLIVGTKYRGVDVFRNNSHNNVMPNGPYSNLIFNSAVDNNGNVWVVSGSLGNWQNESGIYKYNGSTWTNYVLPDYPQIGSICCGYVQVYASKDGSKVWASGFGLGLLEFSGNTLQRYVDTNSVLCAFGAGSFVLVEGVKEDNNGNLWLINRGCPQPIVNYTTGEKYPVPANPTSRTLIYMVIDNYNTKWMTFPPNEPGSEQGIAYWNESIPSGNIIRASSMGDNVSGVNNIVLDKNGEVWCATNNGIVIYSDPYQIINSPNTTTLTHYKMKIVEGGLSTPLTEDVTAIGVDALNNKWIGTAANGVIYVSPDGTGSTLLARYNTINSPLPDNKITSITCDNTNGTVYFGTTKGLVAFKTIAISPLADCDKIRVGPNPYSIPSDNQLRIDGLVAESSVKILTISGTLVAEFETPGGRVTEWNGKDLYGNYVSSGIYIIVGYNKDGSKACTGKVAVVRK